ncbi:uncharacterized protein TNCV_3728831 [Trichonephila clavipes]|nr:uncharacterized protein TNCV_3728831 [Trichonephila clavipes]
MFSDESRFSLQSDSRRTLIWRAPGTRYRQEKKTIERHRYGGAGWLVWGRIILGYRTDLHVQCVTMIGHIYRDVILEQHERGYHPYGLASILTGLESNRACVEHTCPTKYSRQPPPTCLPELRRILLDEWCNIPQDQINNLILSMPRLYKKKERCKPKEDQSGSEENDFKSPARTDRVDNPDRSTNTRVVKSRSRGTEDPAVKVLDKVDNPDSKIARRRNES